jgi:O-antigen/teichoic acid export membrane protein
VPWRLVRRGGRRLGWGAADQAMSSLTNFLLSVYVARTLGAAAFGAFSLAYVTYAFALNASRGLATDPFVVRFSGTDLPTWRRAVARCTGTALVVGLATGACAIAAGRLLGGTAGLGFLALGLTLPALLLQDSWRYSFFAQGRGYHAFINDTVWAAALIPALAFLRITGHANVFWLVFAWGASAAAGAAIGPLQARVVPNPAGAWEWLSRHRDLATRYLAEGSASNASNQLRTYGFDLILGLAAVGYIQAAITLMGPFRIIFLGMGLFMVPEAVSLLRRSSRHMSLFCLAVSSGLALLGLACGMVLLVALPRGLGQLMLGGIWRPAYPLVLPTTLWVMGTGALSGPLVGLHALAAARRSLRVTLVISALGLACSLTGARTAGTAGAMWGSAAASWIGVLMSWDQLRKALHERADSAARAGRHRRPRHAPPKPAEPSVPAARQQQPRPQDPATPPRRPPPNKTRRIDPRPRPHTTISAPKNLPPPAQKAARGESAAGHASHAVSGRAATVRSRE